MTLVLFLLGCVAMVAVLYAVDFGIEKFVRIFVPERSDMAPYKTPSYTQQPTPFYF